MNVLEAVPSTKGIPRMMCLARSPMVKLLILSMLSVFGTVGFMVALSVYQLYPWYQAIILGVVVVDVGVLVALFRKKI